MTTMELQNNGLEYIVDRVDVGIVVVDRNLQVVLWNRFMEAHSGVKCDAIVGQTLLDHFSELPTKWLEAKLKSVFMLKNFAFSSWQQRPYLFRFKHHRPVTGGAEHMYQDCTFIPISVAEGEPPLICITVFDVTDVAISQIQLQDAHQELKELSIRDPLTGVYNRRFMETQLENEAQRSVRYGGHLSALLIDLDLFKKVNDNFGHQAGDAVLVEATVRINKVLRGTDTLARYGGEEFAVILPNTDKNGAATVAERIRASIADENYIFEEHSIRVTASIGVSQWRSTMPSHNTLMGESDKALYIAKEGGRNQVVCYK